MISGNETALILLTYTGLLYLLGSDNGTGVLGGNYKFDSPSLVDGLKGVTSVAMGASHVACVDNSGNLYTWGNSAPGLPNISLAPK